MRANRWEAVQVACVYVGTVVGAGFASGQELHQFFGRHHGFVYPAAVLATFLFAWVGYQVMLLGHRLRATSYLEVSRHLFGTRLGAVVNFSLNIMMFGITVAMLAGAGALFQERMGVPFSIGALCTAALTFVTLLYGLKGLLRANTLIVPLMLSFLCIVCVRVILTHHGTPAPLWPSLGDIHASSLVSAVVSAFVYVAFNVGLAAGVLIPVGGAVRQRETLRLGAALGAGALGLMMVAVLATLDRVPGALGSSIPMAAVAVQFGPWFARCFQIILFGEIFSTLAGDLFAIVVQIPPRFARYRHAIVAALLLLAFLISHVGFTSIVAYGYSLFGWVSTAFLIVLLWPRSNRW